MMYQLAREKSADLLLISEQWVESDSPNWFPDELGTAAIWIVNPRKVLVQEKGSGRGFVWIKTNGVTFISVYLTPNESRQDFLSKVNSLEDAVRDMTGDIVIAGDFNASAVEWGMPETDARGEDILDLSARLNLAVLNVGNTTTFRRPGYRQTIPDISLSTEDLAARIINWQVLEDFSASDHQYILFEVHDESRQTRRHEARRCFGWNIKRLNREILVNTLRRGETAILGKAIRQGDSDDAEDLVREITTLLEKACNKAMPKRQTRERRPPAYWWNAEIARLRSASLTTRRRATRARTRTDADELMAEHKQAKKSLRLAVRRSKRACEIALCNEVDNDPWGLGYKIVTKRIGALSASGVMNEEDVKQIVDGLFPTHPEREVANDLEEDGEEAIPEFTKEELFTAVDSLKNGKAPGPDGIPTEILKIAAHECSELILCMYNTCARAGVFSKLWKRARLVLISKGKGDPTLPNYWRPLGLLDTAGKNYEKMLQPRILRAVEFAGDLSPRQYGFRRGKSTIDAISSIVRVIENAQTGNHYSRKITLLVTLDVKNAFNSARWSDFMDGLRNFLVPKYLRRIISSYLSDRVIFYETAQGTRLRKVTAGAVQGSVLGPDLWNIMYDQVLRLPMPEDTFTVGYADDLALVITAKDVRIAEKKLNQAMKGINYWMEEHGLKLAAAKTEIVLFTRKHIETIIPIRIGEDRVETKNNLKYLGVLLDTKLTFMSQILRSTEKAARLTTALSRLMRNTRGPKTSKRRLLMSVTHSIILYGAEVWADSIRKVTYAAKLTSVQRQGALRISCAYRTVSLEAALVIAGVIPIDLLALERQYIYKNKEREGIDRAKISSRQNSLSKWQNRWTDYSESRWTKRLIGEISPWITRGHGDITYFLTQFLSGHGLFCSYLFRIKKMGSGECVYCPGKEDTAEHTFFECDRWAGKKFELETNIGLITPDNVISLMLRNDEVWSAISEYVEYILRTKKPDIEGIG